VISRIQSEISRSNRDDGFAGVSSAEGAAGGDELEEDRQVGERDWDGRVRVAVGGETDDAATERLLVDGSFKAVWPVRSWIDARVSDDESVVSVDVGCLYGTE
jgi:hypothetical protein